MLGLLARRGIGFIVTLVLASLVVFMVLEVLPGDPARQMLGIDASADAVEALRERLGLDRSWPVRYAGWVAQLARGDLGMSLTYGVPVGELIAERAGVSLALALAALLLTVAIALPIGVLAAARRGGRTDAVLMSSAQFGIAVPNFWLGIILVFIFAITLRLLPSGGFPGWDEPLSALRSLVLPAVSLAIPQAAILSRVVRSSLVETLGADFIRTARAKGAGSARVVWRHALRTGLLPVLTIIGLQFAFLLSGVIVIEEIFSLPGLGRLAFQAITRTDMPVVRGVVMVLIASVVLTNFIVDLAYLAADPRLRVANR